jgi:hypothetical protein
MDVDDQIIREFSESVGEDLKESDFDLNVPKMFTDIFTAEFDKYLKYTGPPDDIKARLKHKVLQIWLMWNKISQDNGLAESISNVPEDHESEEFRLKQSFLFVVEEIAYILSTTDVIEEIIDNPEVMKMRETKD